MTNAYSMEFNEQPGTLGAYLKALKPGSRLQEGESIPRIEATLHQVDTDPGKLQKYRQVCGFSDSDRLPATFPHILASPLHMHVMTSKAFPLRLLGLVHVRNRIVQHRPVKVQEPIDVHVWVQGHRDVHNGVEFDMTTELRDKTGKVAWEETSTMLSRGKGKGEKPSRKPASEALEFGRYASFSAPSNIGRRYGMVSGDVNPIHISAVSARLFGFPRAIAHGMWLLARCAAEVEEEYLGDSFELTVAFRQPVLLPSEVIMKYSQNDDGLDYQLTRADGAKTHLGGCIRSL